MRTTKMGCGTWGNTTAWTTYLHTYHVGHTDSHCTFIASIWIRVLNVILQSADVHPPRDRLLCWVNNFEFHRPTRRCVCSSSNRIVFFNAGWYIDEALVPKITPTELLDSRSSLVWCWKNIIDVWCATFILNRTECVQVLTKSCSVEHADVPLWIC